MVDYYVTLLDPAPRGDRYAAPSVSRRGGVRLHPIRDGVIPTTREAVMRKRDKAGNKLRDVVDPSTGWCIGVESNLESAAKNTPLSPCPEGTSASPTILTKRADVRRMGDYWVDSTGCVIRTVSMGDDQLPLARVCVTPKTKKERVVRKPRAASSGQPGALVPGATGPNGRITRSDCIALINALAQGRKVVITDKLINQARELLKQRRAKAARKLGL